MDLDRELMVRMSEEQHRALRAKAADLSVPVAEMVRALAALWLKGEARLPDVVRRGGQV